MPRIAIGQLRDWVTLQSLPASGDSDTVTTVGGMRARVTQTGGGETVEGDQLVASATYEVVIHARTDVTPLHQFVWSSKAGAKTLRVKVVDPTRYGPLWLALDCVERV